MARTEPKRSATACVTTRQKAASSFGGTTSRIFRSARTAAGAGRVALTATSWDASSALAEGTKRGLGIGRLRRGGLAEPRGVGRAERPRIGIDIRNHRQKARRRNTQTHDPFRFGANHAIGRGDEKHKAVMRQIMQRLVDPPTRMVRHGRDLRHGQRDHVVTVLRARRQEAQGVEEQRVRTRRLGKLEVIRHRGRRDGRTRELQVGTAMERRVPAPAPDRRPRGKRHSRRRGRVLANNGRRKSVGLHRNHPSKDDGQTTPAAQAAAPGSWLARLAIKKPRTGPLTATVHTAAQSLSEPGIAGLDGQAPERLGPCTALHRHPRRKHPPTGRKRRTGPLTGTVHTAAQSLSEPGIAGLDSQVREQLARKFGLGRRSRLRVAPGARADSRITRTQHERSRTKGCAHLYRAGNGPANRVAWPVVRTASHGAGPAGGSTPRKRG